MVYRCIECRCDLPPGAPMTCPTCRQISAIKSISRGGTATSDELDGSGIVNLLIIAAFLIFDAYHHFVILTCFWFILKVSVYAMCLGFFWADPASFGI